MKTKNLFFFLYFIVLTSNAYQHSVRDYSELACAIDWHSLMARLSHDGHIDLLDVGCGTGRWIEAFDEVAKDTDGPKIKFDLLDPSGQALTECSKKITSPFLVGRCFQTTIQDVQFDHRYDLVWAVHSFYALRPIEIKAMLKKCFDQLNSGGHFIVVIAENDSFYARCYDQFRKSFSFNQLEHYATAQQIEQSATDLDLNYKKTVMAYHEMINRNDTDRLSHYLLNECIGYSFNRDGDTMGTITLETLQANQQMGQFLENYFYDGYYYFPQIIWIFDFVKP